MPSPKYIIATDRRPYTVTASTEDADRPASNVGPGPADDMTLVQWPSRTWRDDGTGVGSSLVCDLGATPPALAACGLYGSIDMADRSPEQTVTGWDVEESATGTGGWSALPESPLTVGVDAGKRRGYFPITTTERYIRFTVATGGLAAGATYAQLGVLDLYSAADLVTLNQNPTAPELVSIEPVTIFTPDGGGPQVNEDGPPRQRFLVGGRFYTRHGTFAQLEAIRALGQARVFALYQNNGNSAEVLLCRRLDASSYVPGNGTYVDYSLTFEEVA